MASIENQTDFLRKDSTEKKLKRKERKKKEKTVTKFIKITR